MIDKHCVDGQSDLRSGVLPCLAFYLSDPGSNLAGATVWKEGSATFISRRAIPLENQHYMVLPKSSLRKLDWKFGFITPY